MAYDCESSIEQPLNHYNSVVIVGENLSESSSVLTNQVSINAASSSSLKIVCIFIGATRVFDATMVDEILPSSKTVLK